ncbi:hypothetical protein RRG08_055097 [Elysia crispata]|uniref:Uncharacterized protein n=1 Tax=Elysia crispata TaxID=231223 RepID=A0AAE1DIL7_9GAST|nr:hypothetical protein RRG08_055097 [Elysia crispata]
MSSAFCCRSWKQFLHSDFCQACGSNIVTGRAVLGRRGTLQGRQQLYWLSLGLFSHRSLRVTGGHRRSTKDGAGQQKLLQVVSAAASLDLSLRGSGETLVLACVAERMRGDTGRGKRRSLLIIHSGLEVSILGHRFVCGEIRGEFPSKSRMK